MALGPGAGARVILFVGVVYFVLGALTLRSVIEPPPALKRKGSAPAPV
jgi:hypothetical protein